MPNPVTEEDVRRAYYASAGAPLSWWIAELQMQPAALIVADEASGKLYRVPYTVEGSAVSFGAAAEIAAYSEVAAGRATGEVVVYASAEESRAVEIEAEFAGFEAEFPAATDEELWAVIYPDVPVNGREPGDTWAAGGLPDDGTWDGEALPGHGLASVEHDHDHSDYSGGTHSHPHVHRGDAHHGPSAGHGHGPGTGDPLAAGIAASIAEKLAADPASPAGLTLEEVYRRMGFEDG